MTVAETPGIPISDEYCEPALACPACGYFYSHIRSVHTALGSDPLEAGGPYRGTEIIGCTGARRNCLVITVDGECGHSWEVRIQQHKGVNYVATCLVHSMEDKEQPQ